VRRELARFLWRNLSRNKVRSILTGGAIALAIALVCFLATMPDGMNRILEQVATNTRIVVHNHRRHRHEHHEPKPSTSHAHGRSSILRCTGEARPRR